MAQAIESSDFLAEAASYLDVLDRESETWEDACSPDSVQRALRAMHTLKGTAGFMGEDQVEALADAVEEVIAVWSDVTPEFVDRASLVRVRMLATALRRELGLHRGSGSEIPDSKPKELAGEAFVTLLRQARRFAAEHGKHVQVCLSGTKVAIPQHIIEVLRGPLGHILRNAVAHAVEPPDVRGALGKPYFATLLIEVEESRTEILVRVRDDGAGFDLDALRGRVIGRRLATRAETEEMSTKQLIELAFLPGVSTANEVSALAGRGVGLEAARAAIEAGGGTLELTTGRDVGTTVMIRVPRSSPRATNECLKT
ncbi:MAG TPA: ATP-binding protein [Polyangiaceae bacterium]|jgi:chemotaxis protein histidine kinase CheA|nr:ATP-binding protein [Polyangiaceae bacterium]